MHNNFPNNFYFINSFKKNNIDKLNNNTGVIYRNYKEKLNISELIKIKDYCSKRKMKFFLSNDIKISLNLKLDGVYLPSFNRDFRHLNYNFSQNFIILGSAHNIKEIRIKENQKVRYIFISSLFKKNKNYLGIYKFKKLKRYTSKKVIALGGISKSNIKMIKLVNCDGFSGISFFEKKKGPNILGPFYKN